MEKPKFKKGDVVRIKDVITTGSSQATIHYSNFIGSIHTVKAARWDNWAERWEVDLDVPDQTGETPTFWVEEEIELFKPKKIDLKKILTK